MEKKYSTPPFGHKGNFPTPPRAPHCNTHAHPTACLMTPLKHDNIHL
ncbi:hypothetical protein ARMA_0668 [Ardenticatena maritima]|uniref:Uncharacterized protein n=1 Tax=Ardenticatena maritima TaxID=872965 RepID=A0A0M8K5P3_9CHLR|nr:hypothetical protein ARMA_0668 [Ardenticatena maritima]